MFNQENLSGVHGSTHDLKESEIVGREEENFPIY
jgi:hypothetical protein